MKLQEKFDARMEYRDTFYYEHIFALKKAMMCDHVIGHEEKSTDEFIVNRCNDCNFVNASGGWARYLLVEVLPKYDEILSYPKGLLVGSGH